MAQSHALVSNVNRRRRPFHVILRDLAKKVRWKRAALNLTLMECAHEAGLHWRHWQKIEAGEVNITMETLCGLARALKMDPHDLLRREAAT